MHVFDDLNAHVTGAEHQPMGTPPKIAIARRKSWKPFVQGPLAMATHWDQKCRILHLCS